MKKFSIFTAAALMLAAVSCNKEAAPIAEPEQGTPAVQKITFTAYADNGADTRTILNGNDIKWAVGETIYVFDGTAPRAFTSTNTEESAVVSFEGEAAVTGTYTAVSPAATMTGNTINATIPVFQTATANSFDPKANVSVAVANGGPDVDLTNLTLQFKNAGAVVKFKLTDNDIVKVRLDAIGGEKLAGKASITLDSDNLPTVAMASDAESCVILKPADGNFAANTTYAIAVAPGTYAQGFKLTLFKENGQYKSFSNKNTQTLGRNKMMDFGTIPAVQNWKGTTQTTLFTETFSGTEGSGGRDNVYSGQVGSSKLVPDNSSLWGPSDKCGGAYQCLKFGNNSSYGSFYVEGLSLLGDAVLTFSAAGWGDTSNNVLNVDIEGADATGDTDIVLANGAWNNYTVNISNVTGDVTITFNGKRGFLDDIVLVVNQGLAPADPEDFSPALQINNVTPRNGKVGPTDAEASFDIESNVPWSLSVNNENAVGYELTPNGNVTTVTVLFEDLGESEDSRTVVFTVTPSEGTAQDVIFVQSKTLEPETIIPASGDETNGSHGTNCVITYAKNGSNNSPAWNASSSELRLYVKNSMTVSALNNYKISKIEITYIVNANNKGVKPTGVSANKGSMTTGYSSDGGTMVWENSANTSDVEFTVNGTAGNIAIASVKVTLE